MSCPHKHIELKDATGKIYSEAGVMNNMFGQREFQFANCHCKDCPTGPYRVIRYKGFNDWGNWTKFDVTKCHHPDSCLIVLSDKNEVKASSSRWLTSTVSAITSAVSSAASSAVSTATSFGSTTTTAAASTATADVQCAACQVVFKSAAKQFNHKHWNGQRVVVEADFRINRDKLVSS